MREKLSVLHGCGEVWLKTEFSRKEYIFSSVGNQLQFYVDDWLQQSDRWLIIIG